ncbi:hypothetical protein DFH09DRAFT_1136544 [Mycena vulgaris]|nr:hypothetical protein DFH09DRAFT_1136544 [Mycena vulgaris]
MPLPSAVKQPLPRKFHVHIRRESEADFAAHAAASASAQRYHPGAKDDRGLRSLLALRRGALAHFRCLGQGVAAAGASGRARSGPGSGMAGIWAHGGGVCEGKRRWGEGTSSAPLEYGNLEKTRYPRQRNAQKPSAATRVPRPKRHGPRRPAPSGTRPTRSIDYHRRLNNQRCTLPS